MQNQQDCHISIGVLQTPLAFWAALPAHLRCTGLLIIGVLQTPGCWQVIPIIIFMAWMDMMN